MWSKLPGAILIAGLISLTQVFPKEGVGIFRKDNVVAFPQGDTGTFPQDDTGSIPQDSTRTFLQDSIAALPQDSAVIAADETLFDSWDILPTNLSSFQRDSILGVIPKDTASLALPRDFNESLTEKYASDNALQYERNVSKSFLQRLKEMISAWLDKLFGTPDTSKINKFSDRLLNILLVLVFLGALYIVVRLFMNHRGGWFFEKKNETVPIDLSNVEKHIHEADFETLLHQAEQQGDSRQSVRLLYLWLLKIFSDNGILQWNPDKTNIDYLAEIKDHALREQFAYLAYLYNYIWYGRFSINDSEYRNARKSFLHHIKTVPGNE